MSSVQADATIALDDAFGDGAGVLLVAGTGSSAFARAPDGRIERCGGWGPNIGDEGSAAWLGRRALSVVTASHDGREPETALNGALLTALELESLEEIIPWAAEATPAILATLAPVVMQVAATGDLRANALISLCVEELMLHIRTLARRCFVDERAAVPVALAGGLMSKGSLRAQAARAAAQECGAGCDGSQRGCRRGARSRDGERDDCWGWKSSWRTRLGLRRRSAESRRVPVRMTRCGES